MAGLGVAVDVAEPMETREGLSAAEAEVLAGFHAFRKALKSGDVKALDRLMTAGYRSYDLRGGAESREMVLEACLAGSNRLEAWEISDLHVEIFADAGVVTGKGFLVGTWNERKWNHHLRFTDLYRRTDDGWRLHLSQATPICD
jgi:hypothetical protein